MQAVYSPPPSMLFSTITIGSCLPASASAAGSASAVFTFSTATLEPSLAGFTNSGRPSFATMSVARREVVAAQHRLERRRRHAVCCHTSFVRNLSRPSADPSTPLPV